MIVCGVDPGSRATGYAVLDIGASGDHYVAHGTIRPKSGALPGRLCHIYREIETVLTRFAPEEMALESSFYAKNAQTAMKLGQVRGVIILAASLMDIPVFEYTPTEVKMATCGYGHADKEQVNAMITTILHLEKGFVRSRDASDALAIGVCHSSSRLMRIMREKQG
ncbi:MAG: crossover junction endodeoxyribonuclease RuvC [Thermodesulfobacteriota bacterium]|nr:crossover junction endodeoxyribonuclease RuvC [Thermodesulfobacteriota bacterium]